MSQVVMEGMDLSVTDLVDHMMAFAVKGASAPADSYIESYGPLDAHDPLKAGGDAGPLSFYDSIGLFSQNLQQVQVMLRFFDEWLREETERTSEQEYKAGIRMERVETIVQMLQQRVDGLSGAARSMENKVSREMAEIRKTLTAQQTMLSVQQQQIEVQQQQIESQQQLLDAQQRQLEAYQQQLEAHQEHLGTHQQRAEAQEQRLDGHNERLNGQDERLNGQQQRLETHGQRIEEQQQGLAAHEQGLESHQQQLDAHQQQLDEQPQILPFPAPMNGNGHANGENGNGNGHGHELENGLDRDPKTKWVLLPISSLWNKK